MSEEAERLLTLADYQSPLPVDHALKPYGKLLKAAADVVRFIGLDGQPGGAFTATFRVGEVDYAVSVARDDL